MEIELTEAQKAEVLRWIDEQRAFYKSGQTRSYNFRKEQLKKFKSSIKKHEQAIAAALKSDLNKSAEEAFLTETSIVLQEIDLHLQYLETWMAPKEVDTPLLLFPLRSMQITEPLGCSLIVAPWNYPFQLLMNPLVGALSAGCCAFLKASPNTPKIAEVMTSIVKECFDPRHVCIVSGGKSMNELLFKQRFDLMFFTGSTNLGKVVMRAAAEHLTPVVLELGGKSPAIVDAGANIKIAARRIAWGKCINAGQTCIAPDYVLVQENLKEEFVKSVIEEMEAMYGKNISSEFYPRIVTDEAFDRLSALKKQGRLLYGGAENKATRYMQPCLLEDVNLDAPLMQEEIFGPLLPIQTFKTTEEAITFVNAREKPLAFYYFGTESKGKTVLEKTSSGGACINDVLMHIANHNMSFGGVGHSGTGRYHGKDSYLAFSHQRSVVMSPKKFDLPFRYVPFKFFKWIKRIM